MRDFFRWFGNKIEDKFVLYFFSISIIITAWIIIIVSFSQIPEVEEKLLDDKKYLMSEITWVMKKNIEHRLDQEWMIGCDLSCKKIKISNFISNINYWPDDQWYFFLMDKELNMLWHTYPDFVWLNMEEMITRFNINDGVEMKRLFLEENNKYISYTLVSPDNPERPFSRILYFSKIQNQDWIIWTVFIEDDIKDSMDIITFEIIKNTLINLCIILFLLSFVIIFWSRIERNNRDNQRKFESIIQHLPIWIFRISNWKLSMWNNALLKLLSISEDDAYDNWINVIDYFVNKNEWEDFILSLQKWLNIDRKEIQIQNNNWKKIWVNIWLRTVNEWKNIYFDGWIEDFSKDHDTNELLKKSYEQLQKADVMKDDIIWITWHELRTPLTIIKWFASILNDTNSWNLDKSQITYIEKILNNSDKLLLMINDMLDLTKLESWKTIFVPERINIRELIMQVYEDFVLQSKSENKTININLPKEDVFIEYDPLQLKRVLINLISNALKFVSDSWKWEVDINIVKKTNKVIDLDITDNGQGISKEDIDDVFLKFKQVWWHMKRTSEWTWLGLPIVKSILEHMDSKITVKSEIWKWSKFSFSLKINK